MTEIKSPDPASLVCVAHDVDCAAVAQQMVKLCVISELVDPIDVHKKKSARIFRRCSDV
jgi:hypothetical protein